MSILLDPEEQKKLDRLYQDHGACDAVGKINTLNKIMNSNILSTFPIGEISQDEHIMLLESLLITGD